MSPTWKQIGVLFGLVHKHLPSVSMTVSESLEVTFKNADKTIVVLPAIIPDVENELSKAWIAENCVKQLK